MELKKFLKIGKKDLIFVLATSIIISALSYLSAPHISSGYRSQNTFYLSNPQAQSPQGYNFGGYFSQSTAINVTDTAVAIIQSLDFKAQLLNIPASISARKIAPQLIQITIASNDQQSPKIQMESIAKIFNQKLEALNPNGPTLTLAPILDQVTVSYFAINSKIVALAGFIFGVVFAVLILGLKSYLKS